jgi:hypothetical protein
MINFNYITYINYSPEELKELPKLSIKAIKEYDEPYKMVFSFYYGYSSMYKKYKLDDLNIYTEKMLNKNLFLLMTACENMKVIKYLVSKGVDIHKCNSMMLNAYLLAVNCKNIRLMKYLESIGVNIHKKSLLGNNAYSLAIAKGNIKLMKYIEKKGINIYLYRDDIMYFLRFHKHTYKKNEPYYKKNMNYKLNKFKIIYSI